MRIRSLSLLLPILLLPTVAHARDPLPQGTKPMPEHNLKLINDAFKPTDDYDVPPRLTKAYLPIYPASRLRDRKTGTCRVDFVIDGNGRPTQAKADPDADEKMCAHALYALQFWEFSPAMKDGKPTTARFRMPFHYDIR